MANKKAKWKKWKIGSASVVAVFFLFNYTKSSDAFQQAHQMAITAKSTTQSNQSSWQNFGSDDDNNNSSWSTNQSNNYSNNNIANNNSQTFNYQQRSSNTRTSRS